jgi:hypothetical protein
MSTHRAGSGGRGSLAFPMIGDLVNRVPGGARFARRGGALLLLLIVVIVAAGVARGRRLAAWAPVDVVESRDPLQELPVRIARKGQPLAPPETYDAVLDLAGISSLVLGVDLDYVPKGADHYDAVLRDAEGTERFRDRIAEDYFAEGRFMLRLFARRIRAGDYSLEVEAFETATGEGRAVAAAWFQVER